MGSAPRLERREPIFSGRVFSVERRRYEWGDERFDREIAVHPGAVAVLPVEGDEVVLLRQWRAAVDRTVLEVVAGTRDVEGESEEQTARRELEEEAGLTCSALEPLCSFWNSPGWSSQRSQVFMATGLRPVPRRPTGPEEAAIEVVRLTLADALAEVERDAPADATTLLALRTLESRRAR